MSASRATAIAPSNIAFIKYWGARDLDRAIPVNPSISMTLTRCASRCTAELRPGSGPDELAFREAGGELRTPGEGFSRPVFEHVERIRRRYDRSGSFRIATENTFPSAAGLASSASGFAALTLAVTGALGLSLDPRELSSLARRSGSGSAARSAIGGYVEWPAGAGDDEAHAVALAGPEHWDLRNVVAIVDAGPKAVSSRDGHRRAAGSPFYPVRQRLLPERLAEVRAAIAARDLARLGPAIEEDAIELHLVAMSSRPAIFYWKPGTLAVLEQVRELRRCGVEAYATMDAGANVHVICEPAAEDAAADRLGELPEVRTVIRDRVGPGPRLVDEHLF